MQFVFRSINARERGHSAFSSGFRFLHPSVSLDKTNRRSGRDTPDGDKRSRNRPKHMSSAQDVLTNLLAFSDVRINGPRPWDIQVHDRRFFSRVLASGTLGFGESYMDGWCDCDALDEMCCRAICAGLEKRFVFRLSNVWALLTAVLVNQQTLLRSRKVGR